MLRDIVTGGVSTPVTDGALATLGLRRRRGRRLGWLQPFLGHLHRRSRRRLVLGPITTTRTGCDESSTALATAYLTALPSVATYAEADGTLTLMDATGATVMAFASADMPQVEGSWTPTSFNDGSLTAALPVDAGLTFAFAPDGRVYGNGGCNDIGGPYGVSGTDISIGPWCPPRGHAEPRSMPASSGT